MYMRICKITCNLSKEGSIEKHTHAYTCPLKKNRNKVIQWRKDNFVIKDLGRILKF